MKNLKVLLSYLSLSLLFVFTNSYAVPYQLDRCHIPSAKDSSNVQCIYTVYGQKINKADASSNLYVNTTMPYALCQKSLCTIDPEKPTVANCTCPVIGLEDEMPLWKKVSVGPIFYEINHPTYKDKKLETVTAAFSLADKTHPKAVKELICKFNEPTAWANCFGKRCQVTFENKNGKTVPIAKCQCRIVKATEFSTLGPQNESQCKAAPGKVWSGATIRQAQNINAVLLDSYKRFFPSS